MWIIKGIVVQQIFAIYFIVFINYVICAAETENRPSFEAWLGKFLETACGS